MYAWVCVPAYVHTFLMTSLQKKLISLIREGVTLSKHVTLLVNFTQVNYVWCWTSFRVNSHRLFDQLQTLAHWQITDQHYMKVGEGGDVYKIVCRQISYTRQVSLWKQYIYYWYYEYVLAKKMFETHTYINTYISVFSITLKDSHCSSG